MQQNLCHTFFTGDWRRLTICEFDTFVQWQTWRTGNVETFSAASQDDARESLHPFPPFNERASPLVFDEPQLFDARQVGKPYTSV
jgi:hypothetical protein